MFDGDRASISKWRWTICEIVCRSQNKVGLFLGIEFGGVDRLETRLGFLFEIKFRSLSIWIYLHWFSTWFLVLSGGDMAEINQSTVKIMHIHQLKIDVVKFDDMNNFGMWRCEVLIRWQYQTSKLFVSSNFTTSIFNWWMFTSSPWTD